jgi:hypothetical protein
MITSLQEIILRVKWDNGCEVENLWRSGEMQALFTISDILTSLKIGEIFTFVILDSFIEHISEFTHTHKYIMVNYLQKNYCFWLMLVWRKN